MRVECTNRLSPPPFNQRRQEEEYYTRLEAERRRQHEEAERKLLTPDEPAGLYRPPLPRDYQPPTPYNPTNTPPPPPQRNTSYLKTQVASPDTLYTAKFVSYAGDEEDEEEGKEATKAGSGGGGQSGQVKLSATRKSYGDLPATASPDHNKRQPPPTARKPRPLSDGIFLSGSFQPPVNNSNSTGPPLPAKPSSMPPGGFKGRPGERREESGSQQRPLQLPFLPLIHSSFHLLPTPSWFSAILCFFLPCFSVETCSAVSFPASTFPSFTCLFRFFLSSISPFIHHFTFVILCVKISFALLK